MKKLILILFVLVPFLGNAQFFDYSASVETGYYKGTKIFQKQNSNMIYNSFSYPKLTFYTNFSFDICLLNKLNIENDIINHFTKNSHFMNFSPLTISYNTNINYNFQNVPLEIGWEHNCFHTIKSNKTQFTDFNSYHDKIFIKFTIKN